MLVLRMVEERFHRDVEDRPIREGRTPPELLREGEIEYKQCPHAGSRYLHENPMNVSALRQTAAHWDELVDAIALVRDAYGAARGGYRADLMDIWRASQIASALPWFYILGRGETCPAFAAALSKATLGVGIWGARMLVAALVERSAPTRYTPQMIYDTSEATGTLIADTEVCAASDKMMLRFYEPFCGPTPFRGIGEVARLAEVRDDFLRFGAHYTAFKQWMWLYWLARRILFEEVASVIGRRTDVEALLHLDAEPPDFFLVQPERVVEMPLDQRARWFAGLAALVEPYAPDRSDEPHRSHAAALATIMGSEPAIDLATRAELAAECARSTGCTPAGSRLLARATATYAALDAAFADVIATTEVGLGGDPVDVASITASVRDRIVHLPPRALFQGLAPVTFAAIARA